MTTPPDITGLLQAWSGGDKAALDELMPLVYNELHALAARHMRRERGDLTLQATALVHEAYLRLVAADIDWKNRVHFFAVAARTVRRVLLDHAKSRGRMKRGGGMAKVSLDNLGGEADASPVDFIDLNDALERLATVDKRKCNAIELHYFGGLSYDEIAEATNVGVTTVHRDLRMAKAWLEQQLREAANEP